MLKQVLALQAHTLIDSSLESTRVYWRKEILRLPDDIAHDPRPLREVLSRLRATDAAKADADAWFVQQREEARRS